MSEKDTIDTRVTAAVKGFISNFKNMPQDSPIGIMIQSLRKKIAEANINWSTEQIRGTKPLYTLLFYDGAAKNKAVALACVFDPNTNQANFDWDDSETMNKYWPYNESVYWPNASPIN